MYVLKEKTLRSKLQPPYQTPRHQEIIMFHSVNVTDMTTLAG